MAKKSKKQQEDQQHDDQFFEIPEDRFEQIEKTDSQDEPEIKTQHKPPNPSKPKKVEGSEDAPVELPDKTELSREDLLADVRRSLVSEEDVVEEPKGLFARIKGRFKKPSQTKDDKPESEMRFEFETEPQEDLIDSRLEQKPQKKKRTSTKQEEQAIQEFFSDLEALADVVLEEPVSAAAEVGEDALEEVVPQEKVQIPRLPVKSEKDEIDFDVVREAALQDYDDTRVEVEERKPALQEDVRRTIRDLSPVERFVMIAVGVLTVGALLFSGIYIIANSISVPTPVPTAEPELGDIVRPTRLVLPGGWEFRLGQGRVTEGQWEPQGAEWLVGTEISRWVALPWTLQLEAVLRTLKSGDQLELEMSNFDVLVYNVYSIQEMTMDELLASDVTTPSLLIVLYNDEEADGTFWVVRAIP